MSLEPTTAYPPVWPELGLGEFWEQRPHRQHHYDYPDPDDPLSSGDQVLDKHPVTESPRSFELVDAVKWFTVTVRQASELAHKWPGPEDPSSPEESVDTLSCSTKAFPRPVLTVDMSLSRPSYPYNGDLPEDLVHLLDSREPVQEEAPAYAATVNPADSLSWTEFERFLTGELIYEPSARQAEGGLYAGFPVPATGVLAANAGELDTCVMAMPDPTLLPSLAEDAGTITDFLGLQALASDHGSNTGTDLSMWELE